MDRPIRGKESAGHIAQDAGAARPGAVDSRDFAMCISRCFPLQHRSYRDVMGAVRGTADDEGDPNENYAARHRRGPGTDR